MEELELRELRDGDIESIVNLFNTTFKTYAGFVPRTIQNWTWACCQRPNVSADGIRVMAHKQKVVGYVVVGRSGDVWDMCYDTRLPNEEATVIVHRLLSWAVEYVEKIGADSMQLNFPIQNKTVRKECNKLGFSSAPPEYMFISVLNFPQLVEAILKTKETKNPNFDCCAAVRLKDPSSGGLEFVLDIKRGQVESMKNPKNTPELTIETDTKTLTSVIIRGDSIVSALATSKINVNPFWKTRKCMRLLYLLQNKTQWFMPRADMG